MSDGDQYDDDVDRGDLFMAVCLILSFFVFEHVVETFCCPQVEVQSDE